MSIVTSLASAALYLLPVVVLVLAKWQRDQPLDQLAVLIPGAVAADLLGILLLARGFQLDIAVVISRAGWALGLGWLLLRRIRARAALGGLRWAELAVLGGAGCLALALSVWLSRRYVLWDRDWHIPLVTSLRGQRIPFVNVFQPKVQLGYHVAGDVLAATLQTLSGGRMHSAAALSLAHDISFVLTGISISALVSRFGRGWAWSVFAAVAPLAVLLSGPPNVDAHGMGYALFNFYQMSYRPHVVLAGLLIVGVTAVVSRLSCASPNGGAKLELVPLLAILALFAVTDEPSTVMVVPAVGLTLLVARRELAGRFQWLLVPAAMAAVMAVAWLVLPSTVHGGPRLPTQIVAPQVPSFYGPALPLSTLVGLETLLVDIGSLLALCVALGWAAARGRGPSSVLFTYGFAVLGIGTVLLTCIVVANKPGESHRFMTLPQVVLPLLVVCVMPRLPWAGRAFAGLSLLLPMLFTLNWARGMEPELIRKYRAENFSAGILTLDCRAEMGARLFSAAQPTYVPQREWFAWSGCRPLLAPNKLRGLGDRVDVRGPIHGKPALEALYDNFTPPGGALRVACPPNGGRDPICKQALASSECQEAGHWRVCSASAGERKALLRRR